MERSSRTPDEHIASLADGVREDVATLDAVVADEMAGLERSLWEGVFWGGSQQAIIGYGAYHYRGRSGADGDWFIVGLAAQKNHLSLYVNAVGDGQSLVKVYAPRLGRVRAGSANLQFKRAADVDLDVLREMVRRARKVTSAGG
jgi:hypothetical protein